MANHSKVGSGQRFRNMTASLHGKAKNPAALAAYIGRKKYGDKRFQELAAAGKRKRKLAEAQTPGKKWPAARDRV